VKEAGTMKAWGMDLAQRVTKVEGGLGKLWPYYLLIGFVVATGWYQQRQTMARQARDGAVNQQMQMMGKIFPIFFGFISLTIPAGVVVYFAGQQAIMFRHQPAAGAGPPKGGSDKPAPKAAPETTTGGEGPPPKPPPKPKPQPKAQPKPRPPSGRAQPPGGNGAGRSTSSASTRRRPSSRCSRSRGAGSSAGCARRRECAPGCCPPRPARKSNAASGARVATGTGSARAAPAAPRRPRPRKRRPS
jgi:hypothetical protein